MKLRVQNDILETLVSAVEAECRGELEEGKKRICCLSAEVLRGDVDREAYGEALESYHDALIAAKGALESATNLLPDITP